MIGSATVQRQGRDVFNGYERVRYMSLRTILFDLDGTLIDTNELIIASFAHTFKQFGLAFTKEEMVEFNGPPLVDTFRSVVPGSVEEMVDTYRKHNKEHHDEYVRIFPHVKETLEELQAKGVRIAVVTSKMHEVAKHGIEFTEIDPYIEHLVALDDVKHAKPHPESVIKAMDLIDADPATTLMVGDNYHDIVAGQNAGIRTAGVAWSHKGRDFLAEYEPTYMLEDMRDLLELIKRK